MRSLDPQVLNLSPQGLTPIEASQELRGIGAWTQPQSGSGHYESSERQGSMMPDPSRSLSAALERYLAEGQQQAPWNARHVEATGESQNTP
ncbi:MAG: hypothetical protein M1838_004049 [Thelocarpon superellum]|nr:MAG: hypothetical protein M1838_004049 [Thelocarpon superellum]